MTVEKSFHSCRWAAGPCDTQDDTSKRVNNAALPPRRNPSAIGATPPHFSGVAPPAGLKARSTLRPFLALKGNVFAETRRPHDRKGGEDMLKLRQLEYDEIRRHGEETYPYECCGVLLGRVDGDMRIVDATVRCRNTRTDSLRDRYEIDPVEVVRIQRDARARGLDIVGFYHSHPDHPAYWSLTDLDQAYWLGWSYLITSVEKGKAQLTRSFSLTGSSVEDKAFADEELVIEP